MGTFPPAQSLLICAYGIQATQICAQLHSVPAGQSIDFASGLEPPWSSCLKAGMSGDFREWMGGGSSELGVVPSREAQCFSLVTYTRTLSDGRPHCVDSWFPQSNLGTPLEHWGDPPTIGSLGVEDSFRSHLAHQVSPQAELCVLQFPRDLSNFLNMTSEVRQREKGFDVD